MAARAMGFFESPSFLFTSESVTEGHPDKLCDQVADAVLDTYLAQDPYARVACEVCTTRGLLLVMGEITSTASVDIPEVARGVLRDVGYTGEEIGIGADSCAVLVVVQKQSPDIAEAVGRREEDDPERRGAGDQGIMVGYACREEAEGAPLDTELMPLPIFLAHALCRRLAQVRKEGVLPYLRPDGKSQVTVEYAYGRPRRVHTLILAAQHGPEVEPERLRQDLMEEVVRPAVPPGLLDGDTVVLINSSGRFVVGGPAADTGLTGRKVLVDTYGGSARHGGGCFSGKDPTKVDRSGAYGARYVAKNLVAAGLARQVEVQVSYAIGRPEPVALAVDTFGTGVVPDRVLEDLVRQHFDLRPGALIRQFDLRRPIYRPLSVYGHFGRKDLDLPWERTDKAQALREAVFGARG